MGLETLFELYDTNVHAAGLKALPPDELHGLITAIHCGPAELPATTWMPLVFEAGQSVPERFATLLPQIAAENLRVIDEGELLCFLRYFDEGGQDVPDVASWSKGFLAGMALFSSDERYTADETMKKLIDPIRFLAGDRAHLQETALKTFTAMQKELIDEIEYLVMDVYWHAREEYFGEEFDEDED